MGIQIPKHVRYLIIGAGVHGLSTAWHLAKELKRRGRSPEKEVLVVDKTTIASGASGIACGVIRNFYFQPAMGEVMRISVELWESDPEAFHYHPVGYMALVGELQASDIDSIFERQAYEDRRQMIGNWFLPAEPGSGWESNKDQLRHRPS